MKLFKFLKAVTSQGITVGDERELDPNDAATKTYLELGVIEEATPVNQLDKALEAFTAKFETAAANALTKATSNKGPRFEAGECAEDRQKSFGHWLQLVGHLGNPETPAVQVGRAADVLSKMYGSKMNDWTSKPVMKAANIEGSGPAGGYTVPPEYSTDVWKIAMEASVFANRARRRPMTSNEFRYPKLDQTGTQSAGNTGYTGGVIARWSKETAARTETEPKLKQGIMKAGELTGYSIMSNELIQDNASGLAALVTELFADANTWYLDYATLVGDGLDKPVGISKAPATLITGPNSGGRTTASVIKYADLVYMMGLLFPQSESSAVWIANQTCKQQIMSLQDGSSRNIWLPNIPGVTDRGSVSYAPRNWLLGQPLLFTEKLPVLGTACDIMLVDPNGYMIGDRMGLEIAASPHVNFLNNEMTYRFVSRVAGQPILDKPFTMVDGTNQLSHFIGLN